MKKLLDCIGLTENRVRALCFWAACWCEQRRQWLNGIGDMLWRECDPWGYEQTAWKFVDIVFTALQVCPLSESSLCGILSQNMGMSDGWTRRWLTQMVKDGSLSEMNMNGERWLSLR